MPAQLRGDFLRLAATGLDVAGTRLHAAPSSAGHGDGVVPPKSLNWTHPNHRRIGVAIAETPPARGRVSTAPSSTSAPTPMRPTRS